MSAILIQKAEYEQRLEHRSAMEIGSKADLTIKINSTIYYII